MRSFLAGCLVVLLGTSSSFAGYAVTFSTEQSGAQTQIDVNHTTAFDFGVVTGAPTITDITGDFTLKEGSKTSAPIRFTLWDRGNGYRDPGATALATVSLVPSDLTQSYGSHLFKLSGLSLAAGAYSVSLTSTAADVQSFAYFIKGGKLTADPSTYITFNPQQVPEPGGLALMGIGLGSLGVMAARRRRKPVA